MAKTKHINYPEKLGQKARILELSGDETRIRVLCALYGEGSLCVSELSERLEMTVAAVSHHLQVLEKHDLLTATRRGKQVVYQVSKNPLMRYIKQLICHKEKHERT
jgi:DNA-binding transcriptional ArsR family regulator